MGTNVVVRPPRPHQGRERTARLQRMILRIHGALMLSFAVFTLLPLTVSDDLAPLEVAARFATAAVDIAVLIDLQVRGERLLHTAVLTLPVAFAVFGIIEPRVGDVTSALALAAFALSASQVLTRIAFAICVPLLGAPYVVVSLIGQHSTKALDDSLVAAAMTFAAAVFVDALASAIVRAAEVDAAVARERAALEEDEARLRAANTAGRVLHDEVLVALRMLSDPHVPREALRTACSRAVTAVRDLAAVGSRKMERPAAVLSTTADPLDRVLTSVGTSAPVSVDLSRSGPVGHLCSEDQLAALERALGEVLRNVARHSGTRRAGVRASKSSDALLVEVIDHGLGIPQGQEAGYGIRNSVVAPVEESGGTVAFTTTPGGGTTVRLELPVADARRITARLAASYDLAMRAVHSAGPIRSIAWPIAVVWTYIGLRHSFAWPHPSVSILLLGGYVIATVAVIRRMEAGPLRPWSLAVTGSLLLGLHATGLVLAPDGALLDYRSWFVGWIALPVVLLAFFLPLALGAPLVLSHTVLVLAAWQVDPALSDGQVPWASLNATLSSPVVAVVFGYLLRGIGRAIQGEEAALMRASRERALLRSTDVASSHLDYTRRVVVPWLERLIRNRQHNPDPEIARQARLLAAEVRDDLYAHGLLDDRLRRRVTDFRALGGSVEIRPGLETGPTNGQLVQVLDRLLDVVEPPHAITVTPPRESGTGRVVVTPPVPGLRDQLRSVGGANLAAVAVETDEFRTVVTF